MKTIILLIGKEIPNSKQIAKSLDTAVVTTETKIPKSIESNFHIFSTEEYQTQFPKLHGEYHIVHLKLVDQSELCLN